MRERPLHFLALAFIALVLFQSVLGGTLFWRTIGFNPASILNHYHDKSIHGLLEVVAPHTLFITVALMATLHFLSFTPTVSEKIKRAAPYLLFTLLILDQGSVFMIASGFELFAYIKLASFILFEFSLGWVWILIFQKTLKELA
ncbi:MAG: hypothetical protein PHW64_05425 [Sulfuricurvum sp.]|nr:hypothetical protein [Sulfuricurvum sp.]